MWSKVAAAAAVLALAACRAQPREPHFPSAHRDVAPIVGDAFSTEDARDRVGEAEEVMDLAGIKPGMSVADVGAGEGYYTVRLAPVVGAKGRVLAEDIQPEVRDTLSERVQRERLDNVAVKLGTPDDPMLPPQSFDRIFLVHMYHEVQSPYAFLWHAREGLKPGGEMILVDANRPVKQHGIPPGQAKCEFAALGLDPVKYSVLTSGDVYFIAFKATRPRPDPDKIQPCKS
ncbi:MAG TPA: methyltransferase domain-containing protein [Sphingomicrobium sp.]|nr:methyltransferase domain-containing protein [Sphingomicrobium sp.]